MARPSARRGFRPSLEALDDRLVPAGFADDFEASTLNPFWSTREQSGSITFPSAAAAHAGRQGVRFNSVNTAQDKWVHLYHEFAQPTHGRFSVWVYDTGADKLSSNYLGLYVTAPGSDRRAGIVGYDYDLGPGNNGSTYYLDKSGGKSIPSGVDRTPGWHKFEVSTGPDAITFSIDGKVADTAPGEAGFTRVDLMMFGPKWRPAWTGYFDDFAFAPRVGTVTSTFDANRDGWTVAGDAQKGTGLPTYDPTGGNPGGYLSAKDDVKGDTWYWVAPDKYRGDASGNYGKYLSFDLRQTPADLTSGKDDVVLTGGGYTLVGYTPKNPGTAWTSYSVKLDESAGWVRRDTRKPATAAEIKAALADLTDLRICGEYRTGADTGSLDNVVFGGDAPTLTISDATVTEGNTGTRTAHLTVRLSALSSQPVTVNYATADGTATAADDYRRAGDTLTFAPGQTAKTVGVRVYGDPHVERDETFAVRLGDPTNARLADPEGAVTIRTDDGPVDEVLLNQPSVEGQQAPQVAVDAAGNSVAVWMSHDQDGNQTGVYARRVDYLGRPVGGEFRVNETTAGVQRLPQVAMDAAGNFVVVWEGNGIGDSVGVFMRRYNSAGVALGGEERVNAYTADPQERPSIAMNLKGEFVIAWASPNQAAAGSLSDIYARRFDPAGRRVGGEFLVNTTTYGLQDDVRVAINNRGEFVVAWRDVTLGDGDGGGLFAQRFDAAGTPVRGEFRVNTTTAGDQGDRGWFAVGLDDRGGVVAVYASPDGIGNGVFLQQFDAAGKRKGREVRVNANIGSNQHHPALAVEPDGDFTVGWSSTDSSEKDMDVFIQRFTAAGARVGPETRLNATTAGIQGYSAAIALTPAGQGVAVWSGDGPGDDQGIFLQRFGI